MKRAFFTLISAALIATAGLDPAWSQAPAPASGRSTLAEVKARGHLRCGTSEGVPGFSTPNSQGRWSGFDTDWCRALAAAIFDDPEKAQYTPLTGTNRLIAVQSGEIDVLARTTTWTLSRDASFGLDFTAVNYYDGQGFLVRKSLGLKSAKELSGATVCVQQGTTGELNLGDYFRTNGVRNEIVGFASTVEAAKGLESGRCDSWSTDVSSLSATRLKFSAPDDYVLLPEVISKEPLGAWVRQGDDQWFDVVRWALFAMVNAEELGVAQANVDAMRSSENPEVRRLLGTEGKFGESLGLSNDWAYRIVKHVGNYGESFERHLGPKSRLQLPRGLNNLWTKGGLQYAPPVR